MSVKELELVTDTAILNFKHGTTTGKFGIQVTDNHGTAIMMLDRNQADMLRLYLTEHLSK